MIDAGRCLRMAQKELGIASVVLAKKADSTPQQVVRWRAQKNMKLHTIETICKAMDITINDFLMY